MSNLTAKTILFLLLLAATACSKAPPASDKLWAHVSTVQLEDGTRCAVVESNGGGSVGISCDWRHDDVE